MNQFDIMAVIPALENPRQENFKLKDRLFYIARFCLEK